MKKKEEYIILPNDKGKEYKAYAGMCVKLTFGGLTGGAHTPVEKSGVCFTVTTFCDHDIGVVVDE